MEYNQKEVDFHNFCPNCEYYGIPESFEPCDECLDICTRENSVVPEYFKEAKIKKKEGKNSEQNESLCEHLEQNEC